MHPHLLQLPAPQIVLKDDCGTDFIDKSLVLPCLFADAAVYHGTVGKDGSEAFVVVFHWDGWHGFLPFCHKLAHALQVLTRLTVHLPWLAHDYPLHIFVRNVVLQKLHQLTRGNCRQPIGNNLQWVGDSYASALLPIIYRNDAAHLA